MPEAEHHDFKNAERLKFFTDAVIAIALTLLVLPLLESVPEAARERLTAGQWLEHSGGQLIGFTVSFVVVATFWATHHRLYEHVARYSPRLMWLNFAWMFTIVFLQLPSALMYALPADDRRMIGLYIGTLTLSAALLSGMVWLVYRQSDLQYADNPLPWSSVVTSLIMLGLYALAFMVGVAFPRVNYFALFLLALTGLLRRLALRGKAKAGG